MQVTFPSNCSFLITYKPFPHSGWHHIYRVEVGEGADSVSVDFSRGKKKKNTVIKKKDEKLICTFKLLSKFVKLLIFLWFFCFWNLYLISPVFPAVKRKNRFTPTLVSFLQSALISVVSNTANVVFGKKTWMADLGSDALCGLRLWGRNDSHKTGEVNKKSRLHT